MKKIPKLTKEQRAKLSQLEPKLKACVKSTNLDRAKLITAEIQTLLRPTGHETRILQAKNWLYETAMEANSLTFAKLGFEGTIKKSNPSTRLYLEAVALLAICYIRELNFRKSQELISEVVCKISNIKSEKRREQFHRRFIQRLEEEGILIGLVDKDSKPLDLESVDKKVIKLVSTKSEDEIYSELGSSIPKQSINFLKKIRIDYELGLPAPDTKILPPPVKDEDTKTLGKRANAALRRVAWKAICDRDSEIFQAWNQGLSVVYDKKYITGAIVSSLNSVNISISMLAASVAALAIKFGAEVFCETFEPNSMMIDRKDKK